MKTKLLILSIVLFNFQTIFAQMGGGMRGGGGGMSGGGMPSGQMGQANFAAFKAENLAGMIEYDENEVIKKIKVKDKDKETQQKVRTLIREHNRNIANLKLKYHKVLTQTDLYVKQKREEAMLQKDFEMMQQIKFEAKEKLAPVRQETQMLNKDLEAKMSQVLSKKQLKKWHKYQKQKRKELMPQSANRPSGAGGGGGRGSGRGMRGGGF